MYKITYLDISKNQRIFYMQCGFSFIGAMEEIIRLISEDANRFYQTKKNYKIEKIITSCLKVKN